MGKGHLRNAILGCVSERVGAGRGFEVILLPGLMVPYTLALVLTVGL